MQIPNSLSTKLDERRALREVLRQHKERLLAERERFNWEKLARPEQQIPKGNWSKWVVAAGRGYGKTRVLSEFCRRKAFDMPGSHGVIVGRTAADVRDVIVEGGESSILKISPPDFWPRYEPSKRRLTWPNGSTANLYSADEPDSLRGPQCLIGSTLVSMGDGSTKRIDSVVCGDFVLTRKGPKRVLKAWMSHPKANVSRLLGGCGRDIIGTDDHLVFVEAKGFRPIREIAPGDRVCVTRASSSMAEHTINETQKKATCAATTIKSDYSCTESYGSPTTDQSQEAASSITRTRTSTTTTSRTWRCSPPKNITGFIAERSWLRTAPNRLRRSSHVKRTTIGSFDRGNYSALSAEQSTQALLYGPRSIAQKSALSGSRLAFSVEKSADVCAAQLSTLLLNGSKCIALESATRMHALRETQNTSKGLNGKSHASIAPKYLWQDAATRDSAVVNAPVIITTRVESVTRLSGREPVYDIEVEDDHEFFANGILVHNCHWGAGDELAAWSTKKDDTAAYDNFMMGARLKYKGREPQVMFATTPKPVKVIRALIEAAKNPRSGVIVTRGSTYDNRANLAAKFFNEIITQYEGTRLGRQELQGELLEDIPGQLWTLEMFDNIRVSRENLPEMARIVVAIDPSVTSGENSDECGIVVAGLGRDGLFYLLKDASGVMSPSEWAKEAIRFYRLYHADCIIGEKNNGGDLVEANLRTVEEFVPYRSVWASRGKEKRAQPVASIYELQKVRHVLAQGSAWSDENKRGTTGFEKLELQLSGFTNEGYEGEGSPDRADAAIWALSEFLENGRSTSQMFPEFRAERRSAEVPDALHVYGTTGTQPGIELKPWWGRWISAAPARQESVAHWWVREPSGRVRIYRELLMLGVTPEQFGAEIASQSKEELGLQRSVPVWMPESAFTKLGSKTVASLVAEGIKRSVGEHKAFLFQHSEGEMEIEDQNVRRQTIENRLARMPGGFLCIRALKGSADSAGGWDVVGELLKWRRDAPKAKQEVPNWNKAKALSHDIGAYTAYMASFTADKAEEVPLPRLLIDSSVKRLIQAMSGAASDPDGKLADNAASAVLQSLRIGALASQETAGREPEEDFVARKMESMPEGASGFSMHLAAQRAHQLYRNEGVEGVSLHRVKTPAQLRVM